MTLLKPIVIVFVWAAFITACQANVQATVEAEVIAGVYATVESLPTNTPHPTLTQNPTYTPLPTLTPAETPTRLPTLTPRPTYTPYPTYTPIPSPTPLPTAELRTLSTVANDSRPTSIELTPSFLILTRVKMDQVWKSVAGIETTYHDDDPYDLRPGKSGSRRVPIDCHGALNNYNELLQMEITNFASQDPTEQAAYTLYRQAWNQYLVLIDPIIEHCQTAVANQQTIDSLGDLYNSTVTAIKEQVGIPLNRVIAMLQENEN